MTNSEKNNSAPTTVRVDKWLWAARFFKTRQMATEAVAGGHVHLNGDRVKAGRKIAAGDQLSITKAGMTWKLEVAAVLEKRVSAKLAQSLYVETPESLAEREKTLEQRRLNIVPPAPRGKPDKRQRRKLSAVKHSSHS